MKLFIDANVLVTVLNREYPRFTYCSRILSLADRSNFELVTSPICLAIAWYFSEKKSGEVVAGQKIRLLSNHLSIAEVTGLTVGSTLANKRISDFEDGLEYYAALNASCDFIITEENNGFHFSEIPVCTSRQFFEDYL